MLLLSLCIILQQPHDSQLHQQSLLITPGQTMPAGSTKLRQSVVGPAAGLQGKARKARTKVHTRCNAAAVTLLCPVRPLTKHCRCHCQPSNNTKPASTPGMMHRCFVARCGLPLNSPMTKTGLRESRATSHRPNKQTNYITSCLPVHRTDSPQPCCEQ